MGNDVYGRVFEHGLVLRAVYILANGYPPTKKLHVDESKNREIWRKADQVYDYLCTNGVKDGIQAH